MIKAVYQALAKRLGPHAYPLDSGILYEKNRKDACQGSAHYRIEGCNQIQNIWLADRRATESNWIDIADKAIGVPRLVFFSIKGGVGRSTALAATAWQLAQLGKRVLVLDIDLESPGLSTALLPPEHQPAYGITDWLVEDLVDNGDAVLKEMIATSKLSHDGEIYVVPAHGNPHGEYIAKLGRVWMPKVRADGTREVWSTRLNRLIDALTEHITPDVILIDSRSGIDEVACACVTDLGATLVLLFAQEGEQTWNGYRMLFEQWQRADVARKIRERLQVVGGLIPELGRIDYLKDLRESAYRVFLETLYDEIPPAAKLGEPGRKLDGSWSLRNAWSFDEADDTAPHAPWAVNWHSSFAELRSLQGRLAVIDAQDVRAVFGALLDGVANTIDSGQTA